MGRRCGAQQGRDLRGGSLSRQIRTIRSQSGLSLYVLFVCSQAAPRTTGLAQDHRARHMPDIITIVSSRLEYWAIRFKTQGVLKDTDEKNLIAGMNQQLQFTPRIPIEIATQLGSCLQDASFLKDTTRAMLTDMIDSRVAHVETTGTVVKIKMRTIEFYPSNKGWARFMQAMTPTIASYFAWPLKWRSLALTRRPWMRSPSPRPK